LKIILNTYKAFEIQIQISQKLTSYLSLPKIHYQTLTIYLCTAPKAKPAAASTSCAIKENPATSATYNPKQKNSAPNNTNNTLNA
jgi:hypothetical protein